MATFRFTYTGIRVRNLERSLEFYKNILGMEEVKRGTTGNGGTWVTLRNAGSSQELELNYYPLGTEFATSYQNGDEVDHLAFKVDDIQEAFNELVRKGAHVALEPEKAGKGLAYVKDPDGIWIELTT